MIEEVRKIQRRLLASSERLIGVIEAAPLLTAEQLANIEKPNGFAINLWSETIDSTRVEVFWCGYSLGVWDIYAPASIDQDWVIYSKIE